MRRAIAVVVIVALLGVGGFYYFRDNLVTISRHNFQVQPPASPMDQLI